MNCACDGCNNVEEARKEGWRDDDRWYCLRCSATIDGLRWAIRASSSKWVEKLRSGDYNQIRLAFRTPEGFCALAVLYDIVHPDGWDYDGGAGTYYAPEQHLFTRALYEEGVDPDKVISWNDESYMTFEEIANKLEETYHEHN